MQSLRKPLILLITFLLIGASCSSDAEDGQAMNRTPAPKGMFALYAKNRDNNQPNYITEDFLLLSYCMMIEKITRVSEELVWTPFLNEWLRDLDKELAATKNPDEIRSSNLEMIAVALTLLAGEPSGTSSDSEAVKTELAKIIRAESPGHSSLLRQTIDYTQFRIRGIYDESSPKGRYFQAMRFLGEALFPLVASHATGISQEDSDMLTMQAVDIVNAVWKNESLRTRYESFDSQLTWWFGPADDLTLKDYSGVVTQQPEVPISEVRDRLLIYARDSGRQPSVIGGFLDLNFLEQGLKPADVLTGMRLFPLRLTPDAAARQCLVYDRVQGFQKNIRIFTSTLLDGKLVKGFPLAAEIMALLGSAAAEQRLKESGETAYDWYTEAVDCARDKLFKSTGRTAEQLQVMSYWLARGQDCQPDASVRLRSVLGFWTRLNYQSLLYTKQSYTPGKKDLVSVNDRTTALIDPSPELYLYLEHLLRKAADHIPEAAGVSIMQNTHQVADLFARCRAIAELEHLKQPLSKQDIQFLNDLDEKLLSLIGEEDQPIVVDIHTDGSSGMVLQEAIGYPLTNTVNKEKTGYRGARFSYYEFKQPAENRLNDITWRTLLENPDEISKLQSSPFSSVMEGVTTTVQPQHCP